MIKIAYVMKLIQIQSTISVHTLNPRIDTKALNLKIASQLQPFPSPAYEYQPRTAIISAFGFGGTNAGCEIQINERSELLVLSGRSVEALRLNCIRLADYLKQPSSATLEHIAYTLACHRTARDKARFAFPHEYNVLNGLLGLGPDILLDILSEIRLIPDATQFVGINKKTLQLMKHDRFAKIFEQLNYPISIQDTDPQDFLLADIDGVQKKISKKMDKLNTVSLTQVLENVIGIIEDSYVIPAGASPWSSPHKEHIGIYTGKFAIRKYIGSIWSKGKMITGNTQFADNQIIRLEMDCEKGTLAFFLDDVQQLLYISGINEKVRFIISMINSRSICIVQSLKKLTTPTSKRIENEKAVQW
ncbi:MAG: hypothetical protein EZS28_013830 [Streblomastix strix]|uniref:Uncharacterized protein n=1 Tax=Streblomastix strix TaxID=222440 RepID=A0A5J4W7L8_9EUKA|nr:MAG: hypothetical protein EZS28_013830 [Streblomastix strix]